MTRLVESGLRRSNPTKAFTVAVLAALPLYATPATAATVGATAAKGSATAKAAAATGILTALAGPVACLLGTYIGYQAGYNTAESPRERRALRKFYRLLFAYIGGFILLTIPLTLFGVKLAHSHPRAFTGLTLALVAAYTVAVTLCGAGLFREQRRLAQEEVTTDEGQPVTARMRPAWEYRSPLSFFGLPLVHIRIGGDLALRRRPIKAWFAVADVALGGLFAFGGVAIAPFSMGGLAIGLLPFGGCAVGLLTLGGFSLGWWSFGGCAVGWLAFGWCALAWKAALGNLALAHGFALGAAAYAAHFNDATAQALAQDTLFFRWSYVALRQLYWLNLLWVIPLIVWWRVEKRRTTRNVPEAQIP